MQQIVNIDSNCVFTCPCGNKGTLAVDPSIAVCYHQRSVTGLKEHILYAHLSCGDNIQVPSDPLCVFCNAPSVPRYTFTFGFPHLRHDAHKFTCSERCYILAMRQAEQMPEFAITCKGCHKSFPKRAMRLKRGSSRVSDERYCRSCMPK